ncbi:MAG TPA: glycosyltransferase family 2 protein [Candidatus Saccharibacteria bacterium]|nr:glycosyltransferase family 2 protein [Candidatus Saccharibacteria bacterium]
MRKPKVAIVVLNYKGWRDSIKCVQSLLKQTYASFHIVLIENGSHDKSAQKLSTLKDRKLTYIEESINHGFTGGVNIGIRWAIDRGYDCVALFNNDAQAETDWLENLVNAMSRTKASIVTGLLLSENGKKIDDAGDMYSTWGIPALRAEGQPANKAPESGFVFGATGGATLYSTRLFEDIGLFDDVFFAYNEDVDIDWRAQLAGHTVYYERSAVAYHKHSATSKKMPGFTSMQVCKNLPIVLIKNVPFPMVIPIGIKFIFLYWAFVFQKILRGDGKPALKGVIKSIRLWPHALRERRKIQKNKTVDNLYIRSILHKGLPLRSIHRIKAFLKNPFKPSTEFDY